MKTILQIQYEEKLDCWKKQKSDGGCWNWNCNNVSHKIVKRRWINMGIIRFSYSYKVKAKPKKHIWKGSFFLKISFRIRWIQKHLQMQNFLCTMCVVLVIMGSCAATLDLSNLNVNDFQFFRYQQRLPNGELKPVPEPSPLSIENHFQRAKAGKFSIFI